jgi:hypothetical protein
VIDLIVDQSEKDKKGQLLAEFTELEPVMRNVVKKAASTAALAMKPIIPSFTMPDLSGVTGAMSTAFDAVKEKTHSAFDVVKGKVGNLMPKQPHWREQLEQLKAQDANMAAHIKEMPTIKKLKLDIQAKQKELNTEKSNAAASEKPQEEEDDGEMQSLLGGSTHRNTHRTHRNRRTRRIRASTRALRQRARE